MTLLSVCVCAPLIFEAYGISLLSVCPYIVGAPYFIVSFAVRVIN